MGRRRVGREEPEGRDGGPAGDPVAAAREIVLRQLTTRARSRAELERALDARGVPVEEAGEVLDRFAEVGLVDDSDFAVQWVESRQRAGRSTRVIRQELRTKGVEENTVADALSRLDDDADYRAARAFAERRVSALRGVEPAARVRRLAGALARRGFPSGVVARVVREVTGPDADETP